MKVYNVKYEGRIYSNIKNPTIRWSRTTCFNLETVPASIEKINKVSEDDNFIELQLGERFVDIVDDKLVLEDTFTRTIKFDKKKLRSTGEKLKYKEVYDETEYLDNLAIFVSKIIETNKNVSDYLKESPSLFNLVGTYDSKRKLNAYNLIIFNLPEFEKIITSNNINFLEANLGNSNFEISKAAKLNEVIGIPKFAIQEMKKLRLEEAISGIKELSETVDGNSLKIVFSFLTKTKLFYTKNYIPKDRTLVIDTFLKNISYIMDKGYKVNDLLNYLLKQSFYYNDEGFFTFPEKEAMYLKDYIRMCEKYGLKYDRYPSEIKKMHDIISKNISALDKNSDVLETEFKKAVMEYQEVERTIEINIKNDDGTSYKKEYTFIVPENIKALIQEGNDLHHCVGSYSDLIIDKKSKIVFMRETSDIKKSLVTVEVDDDYQLVDARKIFNESPDDEHVKAINKWLKEIKTLKL